MRPLRGVGPKYATFLARCSEKSTGSNVFKIGGNNAQRLCLLHETHLKRICEKNNAKLKNTTKMVKLSQQILVSSNSFADIMTRDKYFAFKIDSCSRAGNFL